MSISPTDGVRRAAPMKTRLSSVALSAVLVAGGPAAAANEDLRFSAEDIARWPARSFEGESE